MDTRLVIIFHGIGSKPHWAGDDEVPYWCQESRFLSLLDAIPDVSAQAGLPIEITFDDGNASDIEIAAPALQRRGLKATFFVCAGRIGRPGYLDASQLRSLAQGGMTIGSHGWDHVDWRGLHSRDDLHREVFGARELIENVVAVGPVISVAIPFGSYDRRVREVVGQAFSEIHTSDGGLAPRAGDTVPRECYTVDWDIQTLHALARPRPLMNTIRRRLAIAYKQRRGPLNAPA